MKYSRICFGDQNSQVGLIRYRQKQHQSVRSVVVSIIVPCYNYGHFLRETLGSLLEQTFPFWECHIVDDGSFDDTRLVAQEFVRLDSRFKYTYQPNFGLSAARNKGLMLSSGRYIQFLDADDKLQNEKIEKQVAYLESHQEVDIVYGGVVYFGASTNAADASSVCANTTRSTPQVSGFGAELFPAFVGGNIMVVNAAMLKASIISDVGYFNTKLCAHEDWEFWVRCAVAGKSFRYIESEGAHAIVRKHAKSMSKNDLRMLTSHVDVRNWMRGFLSNMALSKENDYQTALFLLRVAKIQMARSEAWQAMHSASLAIWRARFRADVVAGMLCLVLPENAVRRLKVLARKLRLFS